MKQPVKQREDTAAAAFTNLENALKLAFAGPNYLQSGQLFLLLLCNLSM